jgi:hypothetical protein
MQLDGDFIRTGTSATQGVLSNAPIRRDCPDHSSQRQDYRCRILWDRSPTPRSGSSDCRTNKLLMHYGCNTATGQLMQISYLLFFFELGLSFTPLQETYSCYSFLVTHLWMRMLWEKVSKFDIKIVMLAASQKFPREGNQFIMQVLARKGYDWDALLWLNRVRISLQLLLMSDILKASGNSINTEILLRHLPMVSNLDTRWPQERPTNLDMQLLKNTILSICPSRRTTHSMGRFISNTHRLWHLSWCEKDSTLRCLNTDGEMEVVFISGKKPNRFHYSHRQPRSN